MAFTGTPTIKRISDREFRITGVSLAGDASGTIGLDVEASTAEIKLPATLWGPYVAAPGAAAAVGGGTVNLADSVKVTVNIASDVTTPVPISVTKTGTTPQAFVATVHNDTAATVSPALEIYVEFH